MFLIVVFEGPISPPFQLLSLLCFRYTLQNAPDEILITIFQYIELHELLKSVNRVCQRFNAIIKSSSVLWKNVEFPYQLELTSQDLRNILQHSHRIVDLLLPCTVYRCSVYEIDSIFTQARFQHLVYLNLSESPVSTICFLHSARNIRLVVSCC